MTFRIEKETFVKIKIDPISSSELLVSILFNHIFQKPSSEPTCIIFCSDKFTIRQDYTLAFFGY